MFLKLKTPNHLSKDAANLVELTLSIKDQESGNHRKLKGSHFGRNLLDEQESEC
jgi:hypothetical protein